MNLHAQHGPRCHPCSGLGATLQLSASGGVTKYATRCNPCGGSGIDTFETMRLTMSALERRLDDVNKLSLRQAKRILSLEKMLKKPPSPRNSRQMWQELIAWATADGTAVHTTTTETILFPNVTLPGGYMADGRALRLKVAGKWSTTTGTVTHVYRLRWNGVAGTALAITGTVTLLVSITNGYFDGEIMVQTRSNGATGTLLADGIWRTFAATAPTIGSATGAPAVAPVTAGGQTAPAAVTVDLTADTPLSITITHGASSASNTATGMHYTLESLN